LNNEYNSQTYLSQKELVEDIKNWGKDNILYEEEGYDEETKAYTRYSVP